MFDAQSYTDLRRGAERLAAARQATELATGAQACEALREVQCTQDVLDGVHAALLARVDESEAYADEGASSTTSWARRELRMAAGEAGRRRKAGNTLRILPDVAAALGVGGIRAAHVDEFTAGITKLGADIMVDAQPLLLPIAETETPQVLRAMISYLHEVVHPEDLDDKYAKGMERADVKTAKCGKGWHVTGFLPQHVGAKLCEWLKAVSHPESEGDDRAPSARRVDAFEALLDSFNDGASNEPADADASDAGSDADGSRADAAEASPTEASGASTRDQGSDAAATEEASSNASHTRRPRPAAQLLVLADLATLLRLPGAEPATLSGFGHIGQQLLGYLTCGADMTGVLTDGVTDGSVPQANVLNVGRTSRLATRRQRQAVIARQDGVCAAPGCGLSRLDVHHVEWWFRDGGRTDMHNLIGLCRRCHHLVHQSRLTIEADGCGGFTFRRRTGRGIDDHTRVNKQRVRDMLAKLRHAAVAETADTVDAAGTAHPPEPSPPRQPPDREPTERAPTPRLDPRWLTRIDHDHLTGAEDFVYEFLGAHEI